MRIRIGQSLFYSVEIRETVVNADAEVVDAVCDFTNRRLIVVAHLDRQQRRMALRHEVYHAFDRAYPGARSEEQTADFHASVSDDLDQQIEQMGGWCVLDNLVGRFYQNAMGTPMATLLLAEPSEPLPDILAATQLESFEASGMSRAGRAQCGKCETIVGDAAIVTEPRRWEPGYGGRVVKRTLFCVHCGHLASWIEGVDSNGNPNGSVARDQVFDADAAKVDRFLVAHPQASGLIAGEG